MPEQELKTDVEEQQLPQVAILEAIQRNPWSDVTLGVVGQVILLSAIRGNKQLNQHDLFSAAQVSVKDNARWSRFQLHSALITDGFAVIRLLPKFDILVRLTEGVLLEKLAIAEQYGYKLVAGSLLPVVRLTDDMQYLKLGLIWFEEKQEGDTDDGRPESGDAGGREVRDLSGAEGAGAASAPATDTGRDATDREGSHD